MPQDPHFRIGRSATVAQVADLRGTAPQNPSLARTMFLACMDSPLPSGALSLARNRQLLHANFSLCTDSGPAGSEKRHQSAGCPNTNAALTPPNAKLLLTA